MFVDFLRSRIVSEWQAIYSMLVTQHWSHHGEILDLEEWSSLVHEV